MTQILIIQRTWTDPVNFIMIWPPPAYVNFFLIKWRWTTVIKSPSIQLGFPSTFPVIICTYCLLSVLLGHKTQKTFLPAGLSQDTNIPLDLTANLSFLIHLRGMVSDLSVLYHFQREGYTILSLPALFNFGINHRNNCCHHYMLLIKRSNCFSTQIQSCWLSCSKWIFHSGPVIILITMVQWLLSCAYRSGVQLRVWALS